MRVIKEWAYPHKRRESPIHSAEARRCYYHIDWGLMKAGDRRITKDEEVHIYTTNDDVCWGALVYCTAHWGMKRRRRKKKIKETYWECTVNGFCSYILYRIRRAFDVICTFQCTSGSRPMALLIISDSKTDRKKKKPRDKRERESPVWQEGLDVISSMTVLSPPHPPSSFTTFCSARLLERRWACPGPSCADEWTIS